MRLVTRSDFDGLACGALLKEAGLIDSYKFVHPKDIQDGTVEITANDILANVPYAPGCGMWFDHHTSEGERLGETEITYRGMSTVAPSCARVIYDFLGGESRFPAHWNAMMVAVDKVDSADLTIDEIEHPGGWILIGFIMDPRTGLGRFHDYRISNYQLMMEMIEYCRTMTAEQMLKLPDIKERTERFFDQQGYFRTMLKRSSALIGGVLTIDLRDEPEIYAGNRFLVYSMYPECKVSIHINWGRDRKNVALALGGSIINRANAANLGSICLHFGGGGHENVGTCQVPAEDVDETLKVIINFINEENGDA